MAHPVEPKSPWLAISFGCCASRRDSIDSLEDEGQKELKANGMFLDGSSFNIHIHVSSPLHSPENIPLQLSLQVYLSHTFQKAQHSFPRRLAINPQEQHVLPVPER
jgi:hypothetical protein